MAATFHCFSNNAPRRVPVCIRDDAIFLKMDSKHGKRHEDDGVRGEGNVTACLAVPSSEELVPGKGTCSN